jgi:hypothetical protein
MTLNTTPTTDTTHAQGLQTLTNLISDLLPTQPDDAIWMDWANNWIAGTQTAYPFYKSNLAERASLAYLKASPKIQAAYAIAHCSSHLFSLPDGAMVFFERDIPAATANVRHAIQSA